MSKYRREVLAIFKKFHRTRLTLYQGDEPNLAKARAKINEEFKNNKIVQNEEQIPELITIAKEVELFYRTRVVQAVQTDEGKMRLRITPETEKIDNVEYDAQRVEELSKQRRRPKTNQCCQKTDK